MIKHYKDPYLFDLRVKFINGEPVELLQLPTYSFNPDNVQTIEEWIDLHHIDDEPKKVHKKKSDPNLISPVGARRAKSKLSDYIRCNPDMNYFVTLTLAPDEVDRYDYSAVIKRLNSWLGNRVKRNGLKYILVPEHHKDGAIHFHGVCNDALSLSFSGRYLRNGKAVTSRTGKKIYNIADFDLGYTTAIKITGKNGTDAVACYVKKYITKDFRKVGGRYYLHGGALTLPEYLYIRSDELDISKRDLPYTCEFEIYDGATLRLAYGAELLTFLGLLKLPKYGNEV